MALRWIEGFENMGPAGTTGLDLYDAMHKKWSYLEHHNSASIQVGRDGVGLGFKYPNSNSCLFRQRLEAEHTTWIVGFGWRGSDWFIDNSDLMMLLSPVGWQQVRLRRMMNGELRIYTGDTFRGESVGANLAVLQWNYIEVKAYIHDSAGTVEVRVDGNTVLSLSGIDTDPWNHDTVQGVQFTIDRTCMYDDIYVCDGDGPAPHNDFLGPCRIEGISLYGDEPSNQWDASGPSSHVSYLNEVILDDDASYVETDVSGSVDMFSWGSLYPSLEVLGLQLNACTRTLAAHGWELYFRIDSNGTIEDFDSGDEYSAHEYYQMNYGISTIDPDTGVVWTPEGINNATFGVKAV
jgi:hypothetical protein